ncbi:Uu.00g011040.m01.CDS01 [Anthostomella pinea]|uniref:Uu.00g011040.m01.CDS01 n=1 Tax=Anthostomella pinea TaxID=933095 RepID=A0AAI8VYA8_9PEZI|nr:Uu.00g011040.m01.CDS01 [Anthostomella pinea]
MKFSSAMSAGLLVAGTAFASPTPSPASTQKTAAQQILEIAPGSASCASTDECRTNVQVAPLLIDAFNKTGLYHLGQFAAVLALTAFESGDYKYKRNLQHNDPGQKAHWGQGTSNLQTLTYNVKFANSFPELKDKVTAIGSTDTMAGANKLLDLLVDDQYNFQSGPWFMKTQCPDAMKALETPSDAAWTTYMTCVLGSGDVPQARTDYWTAAKKSFNL